MKRGLVLICAVVVLRIKAETPGTLPPPGALAELRKTFKTKLVKPAEEKTPLAKPPAEVLSVVKYDAPVGKLGAYLTLAPKDGKKHPAIIWITGGDSNTIDDGVWKEGTEENDQSAFAFRKAGIVTMYPSLRGGNDNPGEKETFLGEVDDILAAREFLVKQEFVDPARVYLGGHSTGATLTMLTAEQSDKFRAVFSFGPVRNVALYGKEMLPFALTEHELVIRAPIAWLASIKTPTFVFEGTEEGNIDSLKAMEKMSKNPNAHFFAVKGATHFTILAPSTKLIAKKILADEGAATNILFTAEELNGPFGK